MLASRIRLTTGTGVSATSFTAIFVRLAGTAPVTATFYRAVYAAPVLAMLWWRVRHRDSRPISSRALAFASGGLVAMDLAFWHTAIDRIGAGLATVLVNTQVIFVALLAWLVYKERPSKTAFVLVPLILSGVVLLSGLGREDAYGDDPWAGVAFGLLAGVFYSLFILTLRASNRDHLAPTTGPMLDSTIGMGVGALILGAIPGVQFPLELSIGTHGWLLIMSLVGQVVGWSLINMALPRLAALETSVVMLAQPMLTILWAVLIFNEDLSLVQWLGVSIVLGGLLVLSARGAVQKPTEQLEHVEPPPRNRKR